MAAEHLTLRRLAYEANAVGEIHSATTDSIEIRGSMFRPGDALELRPGKRAAAVADDEFAQVDIEADADILTIITTTRSAVGKLNDSIRAAHRGGRRRVTLSARRLQNALAIVDDTQVTLAFRPIGHLISIHPGVLELPSEPTALMECDNLALLMGISGKR